LNKLLVRFFDGAGGSGIRRPASPNDGEGLSTAATSEWNNADGHYEHARKDGIEKRGIGQLADKMITDQQGGKDLNECTV
jgi:hypothetical protein